MAPDTISVFHAHRHRVGFTRTHRKGMKKGPLHRQVSTPSTRKAWARLLAKVYELDVMACPQCGSKMEVIAVILNPAEIRKIINCLARHGRGPPAVG